MSRPVYVVLAWYDYEGGQLVAASTSRLAAFRAAREHNLLESAADTVDVYAVRGTESTPILTRWRDGHEQTHGRGIARGRRIRVDPPQAGREP